MAKVAFLRRNVRGSVAVAVLQVKVVARHDEHVANIVTVLVLC